MKNTIQLLIFFFFSLSFIQCTDEVDFPEPLEETETEVETVTDIDGNVYQTIVGIWCRGSMYQGVRIT